MSKDLRIAQDCACDDDECGVVGTSLVPRRCRPPPRAPPLAAGGAGSLAATTVATQLVGGQQKPQQKSNGNMERDFVKAGNEIVNIPRSHATFVRRWMAAFGALPLVCCWLWERIDPFNTMPGGVQLKHLLWGLYFLRVYDSEENSAKAVGRVDEKTYREWSWRFAEAISYLECDVIMWKNRLDGDIGNVSKTSVDATDTAVQMKFAKRFMSHKFKGNGLKWEVGINILTGDIVWVHGPTRCGEHDIEVARQAFVSFLNDDEMAVSDRGYAGEFNHLKTPSIWHYGSDEERSMARVVGQRHETVNKRFKIFQVVKKPFRHPLAKQSACFRAVAVITQLNIMNGAPLFQVNFYDEGCI